MPPIAVPVILNGVGSIRGTSVADTVATTKISLSAVAARVEYLHNVLGLFMAPHAARPSRGD